MFVRMLLPPRWGVPHLGPFASDPNGAGWFDCADHVEDDTPRLLINRERAGQASPLALMLGNSRGFNFGEGNYR